MDNNKQHHIMLCHVLVRKDMGILDINQLYT